FWRDMGYVVGGLLAGVLADTIEFSGTIAVVAGLTMLSGLWAAADLRVYSDAQTRAAQRA
ncbi:MAG: MFS transporter, partial [Actinomycetota bacterium]|nr:MFS transporter [Actinomycetota bacterium]